MKIFRSPGQSVSELLEGIADEANLQLTSIDQKSLEESIACIEGMLADIKQQLSN